MRSSKLLHLFVAAAIVAGSLFLYPTALQADMCDSFGHDFFYYDPPDINGNCPIDPTVLVGENWLGGVQGGCNIDRYYTYCGDCERP